MAFLILFFLNVDSPQKTFCIYKTTTSDLTEQMFGKA